MKRIVYMIMSIVLLCSCAGDEGKETVGSIYGIITDKATGEPIRSAGVLLNPLGINTVTGSEGQYEFTNLQAGNYTLLVTKTGYSDLSNHKIVVGAGKAAKGDVQLEKLPPSLRVVNDHKQDITSLDFGDATADITRSFSIFNDGTESLEWVLTKSCEWIIEVSKTTGTLKEGATQAVIITIDREKLTGGTNTTTIHVTSNNGSKNLTVMATGVEKKLPTLNALPVTEITSSKAIFNGKITFPGLPTYDERGFVYSSTSSMPTIEETLSKLTAAVTQETEYTAQATGLTLDQTYYVRAYAKNSQGVAYSSNVESFTATAIIPTLSTQAVSNISIGAGMATFNGTILTSGDPAYTERGFVYAIVRNPTIDDTKKIVSGTGTGAFSANITGLIEGKIYYVRSYATNIKKVTVYGSEVSCNFNAVMPVVSTQAVTNISATTATLNGTVVSVGDPAYTARGFVYSTNPNPTIDDTKKIVSGTGTGAFSANISGLTAGTIYYVRSYSTTNKGTVYGAEVSFKPESSTYVVLQAAGIMVQKVDISANSLNWSSANSLCKNSTVGGYTDWRLPTKDELAVLYNERNTIGGFQLSNYWSSSLYSFSYPSSYYYRFQGFHNGNQAYWSSENSCLARAVRTLP